MAPNQLLRKLRIERGISQKELAKGISARNTLSSYELGGNTINYHLLRLYLDKLNVSVEEFDFLQTNSTIAQKKLYSATLEDLYYHHEYEKIISLLEKIESNYTQTGDFYYFHLLAQYRMAMNNAGIAILSQSESDLYAEKIKQYLGQIDSWGKFEAALFINFMYIFDTEYVLYTLKYVQKKQQMYCSLYKKYRLLEKMHLNALYLLVERGENQLLPIILESFTKIIDADDLKSKVIISFFGSFIAKDTQSMNAILQILRSFEMNNYADYLKKLTDTPHSTN